MKPEIINSSSLEYPFWDPILHPISYIENIPWKLLKILKKKRRSKHKSSKQPKNEDEINYFLIFDMYEKVREKLIFMIIKIHEILNNDLPEGLPILAKIDINELTNIPDLRKYNYRLPNTDQTYSLALNVLKRIISMNNLINELEQKLLEITPEPIDKIYTAIKNKYDDVYNGNILIGGQPQINNDNEPINIVNEPINNEYTPQTLKEAYDRLDKLSKLIDNLSILSTDLIELEPVEKKYLADKNIQHPYNDFLLNYEKKIEPADIKEIMTMPKLIDNNNKQIIELYRNIEPYSDESRLNTDLYSTMINPLTIIDKWGINMGLLLRKLNKEPNEKIKDYYFTITSFLNFINYQYTNQDFQIKSYDEKEESFSIVKIYQKEKEKKEKFNEIYPKEKEMKLKIDKIYNEYDLWKDKQKYDLKKIKNEISDGIEQNKKLENKIKFNDDKINLYQKILKNENENKNIKLIAEMIKDNMKFNTKNFGKISEDLEKLKNDNIFITNFKIDTKDKLIKEIENNKSIIINTITDKGKEKYPGEFISDIGRVSSSNIEAQLGIINGKINDFYKSEFSRQSLDKIKPYLDKLKIINKELQEYENDFQKKIEIEKNVEIKNLEKYYNNETLIKFLDNNPEIIGHDNIESIKEQFIKKIEKYETENKEIKGKKINIQKLEKKYTDQKKIYLNEKNNKKIKIKRTIKGIHDEFLEIILGKKQIDDYNQKYEKKQIDDKITLKKMWKNQIEVDKINIDKKTQKWQKWLTNKFIINQYGGNDESYYVNIKELNYLLYDVMMQMNKINMNTNEEKKIFENIIRNIEMCLENYIIYTKYISLLIHSGKFIPNNKLSVSKINEIILKIKSIINTDLYKKYKTNLNIIIARAERCYNQMAQQLKGNKTQYIDIIESNAIIDILLGYHLITRIN